jgi:hypothetical protein
MHKIPRFCKIYLTLSELIRIVASLSTVVTNRDIICYKLIGLQNANFY